MTGWRLQGRLQGCQRGGGLRGGGSSREREGETGSKRSAALAMATHHAAGRVGALPPGR